MIETNEREPTLSSISAIAKALDVPMPIVLFLAADKSELKGLDPLTSARLSEAAMNVIRAM